jgi:hypothetical protein
MCVDYNKGNLIIDQDAFSLPFLSQIHMKFQSKESFTKLALSLTYHQIGKEKHCQKYTAFGKLLGNYK